MSLMYFVISNKQRLQQAVDCKVKNVLVSYWYMKKFDGDLAYIKNHVERVFVDSGAHSAMSLGVTIDQDEYYDFLIENRELITTAAHFDVVDNIRDSTKNLKHAEERGLDWILPVLQGYWPQCLANYNRIRDYDYYGLGGQYMMRKNLGFTLYDAVNKLPRNKKYHGFAKVNFDLMRRGQLYSADSSSWVSTARYNLAMVAGKGKMAQDSMSVFGHGKDSLDITRYCEMHKEDLEVCGITKRSIVSGSYYDNTKLMIAIFYRPILRRLGLFDQNFYS